MRPELNTSPYIFRIGMKTNRRPYRLIMPIPSSIPRIRPSFSKISTKNLFTIFYSDYSSETWNMNMKSAFCKPSPAHCTSLSSQHYGRRAFSIASPTVRYSLPDELRDPACGSDSFKQFLKTILFTLY